MGSYVGWGTPDLPDTSAAAMFNTRLMEKKLHKRGVSCQEGKQDERESETMSATSFLCSG